MIPDQWYAVLDSQQVGRRRREALRQAAATSGLSGA